MREGQRVTRAAALFPGERRDGIGSNWGAFAEIGKVRDMQAAAEDKVEVGGTQGATILPDDVDPVSAALSVNQREILSVARRWELGPASRVLVLGSGYNGLLFSIYCKHFGAGRVVMVGSGPREAVACGTFDADAFVDYHEDGAASKARQALGGEPTHLIDAVGTVASLTLAKELLGAESAFGRYGLHEFKAIAPLTEEIQAAHRTLEMGTDEVGAADQWYRLWKDGFFDREGIHDGTMPLDEIVEAFERLRRREAAKLTLIP
jgi:threonine dehydrogenase-like Zn-dependent dehydrogenase